MTKAEECAKKYIDDCFPTDKDSTKQQRRAYEVSCFHSSFLAGWKSAIEAALFQVRQRITIYDTLIETALNDATRYRLCNEQQALRNVRSAIDKLDEVNG